MKDYREKVRKLLALAESSNEFEAKAALLKAKELMAEHKLTDKDLQDLKRQEVKRVTTGIVYTSRGEWWIGSLSLVIAENYCCRTAGYRKQMGAQKREVIFVGLEDDVELCKAVFEYAVNTARRLIKEYVKPMKADYSSAYIKTAGQSYGYGFADGVKRAFEEQKNQKEEGWGLVMAIPKEVNDYCKDFKTIRGRSKSVYDNSKAAGYTEGKKFNANRCLA